MNEELVEKIESNPKYKELVSKKEIVLVLN